LRATSTNAFDATPTAGGVHVILDDDLMAAMLTVYARSGYLPEREQLLFCHPDTTLAEALALVQVHTDTHRGV
jgi:hypothetical protein